MDDLVEKLWEMGGIGSTAARRIEALEADLKQAIASRDGFAEAGLKVEVENARLREALDDIGGDKLACCGDPYCNIDSLRAHARNALNPEPTDG